MYEPSASTFFLTSQELEPFRFEKLQLWLGLPGCGGELGMGVAVVDDVLLALVGSVPFEELSPIKL